MQTNTISQSKYGVKYVSKIAMYLRCALRMDSMKTWNCHGAGYGVALEVVGMQEESLVEALHHGSNHCSKVAVE